MEIALAIISIGLFIFSLRQTLLLKRTNDSKKELKDKIKGLGQENKTLCSIINQKDSEISGLKSKISDESRYVTLIEELNAKITALQRDITTKDKEINSLNLKILELEKQIVSKPSSLLVDKQKIRSLQDEIDDLNLKFRNISKEKEQLGIEVRRLNNLLNNTPNSSQVGVLKSEIQSLQTQLGIAQQYKNLCNKKDEELNSLQNKYNLLFSGDEKLKEEYKKVKDENEELKKKSINHTPPKEPPTKPQPVVNMDYMLIPESDGVLFGDSSVEKSIAKIQDCTSITDFLNNNQGAHLAEMYFDYLEDYISEIRESLENIECDEDEISQEYTINFSKALSKFFIERIVEKAYEEYDQDSFSKSFVEKINKYLSTNCIYTKPINVGETIDTSSLSVASTVKTDNDSLHRKIKEIILPPFYIKYINNFGKIKEKLVCKGKAVVYSTKN